jgi:iron complex transport system substrate-binding protein
VSLRSRALRCCAVALVTVTAVAACGASEKVDTASPTGSGDGKTTYPLTIENCGIAETFDAAPSRVVSLDQGSTELMLSLGLADRLVGTASWTDPVRPNLTEANSRVPRLADNAPTYAAVMGTNPDFVTASFGRHLKEQGGVATRARFAETGIPTYLSPTDCDGNQSINGGGKRTKPLTIDSLYQEITELAAIFDVPSRGEKLVGELKQRVDAAIATIQRSDRTVAFWFADTKTPYMAGGVGAPQVLAETVGVKNVFSDVDDDWSAVTWTSVVERNPQILVLGDLARDRFPGDRLDDKKQFLASDPVTATLPAVVAQRYVSLHGAEMNPSISIVDGIEKLAAWLKENPR